MWRHGSPSTASRGRRRPADRGDPSAVSLDRCDTGAFLPINQVFLLHLNSPELFDWCAE